ncbi:alpha/beta hydrolase [Arenimonas fontis]|uniref:Proline iminopeptidase n=1 Tax=Arenimonas fontis TaxID=2608255 RepID=A0A5B2Z816_9GAMM|nr:alpha/beta hydrolase [Arenimonas fontis]KAA2284027.1 alpha/beta hydrolase [Arenimonas fontis]
MKRMLLSLVLTAGLVPATGQARAWGSLEFTTCELGQPGSAVTVQAECARLEVPENPDRPDGRKISLKVAMLAARAAEPAADPVIFLAGGPGQAATETFPAMAASLSRLRDRRHLLFMDQRGTGGSHPLACPFPDELAGDLPPERLVALARDCLAELDADVAQYTTSVAVRDIESLRQALGAPALNVYGGSYGTRVAQQYARQFPDAVRSLILDGIVPPDLALGAEHALNLDAALEPMLAACARQPACAEAFGQPYRRLYTLRDRARATPETVRIRDPLSHRPRELRLDGATVAIVARLFAYAPETAALLPLLVDEALQGRPESLLAQAVMVMDSLTGQINHGMQLSVTCAEDAPRLQRKGGDEQRLLGNALVEVLLQQCSVWPRGPVAPGFAEPLRSDVPALLLSGEFDPVTPPRYGERVAETLPRSRHLIGKGQGHILLARGCTARLAAEFLDSLDPQGLDASCLDVLGASPFFTSYNGAEP